MLHDTINLPDILSTLLPDLDSLHSDVRDIFSDIFRIIATNSDFQKDDRSFRIVKSAIEDHVSYFLLQSTRDHSFYYVDGVSPFCSKDVFGAVKFKLREEHSFDNLATMLKRLRRASLVSGIADLVECDLQGNPIIVELSIPTERQEFHNCSLKSLVILVQLMMVLNYGLDVSKESGVGYEYYKQFQQALVGDCIRMIENMSTEEVAQEKFYCQEAKLLMSEIATLFREDKSSAVETESMTQEAGAATVVKMRAAVISLRSGAVLDCSSIAF